MWCMAVRIVRSASVDGNRNEWKCMVCAAEKKLYWLQHKPIHAYEQMSYCWCFVYRLSIQWNLHENNLPVCHRQKNEEE